jgi:hypothetical protein
MTRYLSVAETAKLIRQQLKREFPVTRFSVRSSSYSMGASITVRWTDGPTCKAVDPVAQSYRGAEFDGMIDMKTGHTSWLMPDGSACKAKDPGTTGSMGIRSPENNRAPEAEAEEVHFGADYIFCEREISAEAFARFKAKWAEQPERWREALMHETSAWQAARDVSAWRCDATLSDFGLQADDVFHAMLRHLSADTMELPPEVLQEVAARSAGWEHGGDFDGFWYHGPTWGYSWKAASSWSGTDQEPGGPEDKPKLYGTLAELCAAQSIMEAAHA